jgi:hypothetical protein
MLRIITAKKFTKRDLFITTNIEGTICIKIAMLIELISIELVSAKNPTTGKNKNIRALLTSDMDDCNMIPVSGVPNLYPAILIRLVDISTAYKRPRIKKR